MFFSKYARFCTRNVYQGLQARSILLSGVDQVADAVGVTLGPRGRNVIIDQTIGAPHITKDGVTVANAIEFES